MTTQRQGSPFSEYLLHHALSRPPSCLLINTPSGAPLAERSSTTAVLASEIRARTNSGTSGEIHLGRLAC